MWLVGKDKSMKKRMIGIFSFIIGVIGVVLILTGIFLNNNSQQKPKSPSNKIVKYPYNGIYVYNDVSIYVYQEDDETVYFGRNKNTRCRARVENELARGICNGGNESDEYTLTIIDNMLEIESNNSRILSGLYTKVSDIKLEEYFEVTYGNTSSFQSKYNGIYRLDDKEIVLYRVYEDSVKLIASSSSSTLVITLNIMEDDTLSVTMEDKTITIKLDDRGNLIFNTKGINEGTTKQFDGEYNKIKFITFSDILKNDIYYYYE